MKMQICRIFWLFVAALLLFVAGCSQNDTPVSSSEGQITDFQSNSESENQSTAESELSSSQSTPSQSQESEPSNNSSQLVKPPAKNPDNSEVQSTPQDTESTEQIGGISNKVTVTAPGVLVKSCDAAVIDYSNTADGYVMICHTQKTTKRLKVQLKGPKTTYTYNLTPEKWTAFPLSDENGSYKITVLQNTTGTKYATVLSLNTEVALKDEFAPFLHSNQFVDFDSAPKTVSKAIALTKGISDPLKKVEKVYDFVVKNLSYDKKLAETVQTGYLPDLDKVLANKKGICFDYAALMTGMLRSQGVPTKLVVGYAGEVYHAWISVWSQSEGWIDAAIYFDGVSWKRMDPTFASSGGGGDDVMNYIGNGNNYSPKYFY